MKARIIGQNHKVVSYELNGRKRFIIEQFDETLNRNIVNEAVAEVNSREWTKVYNYIDELLGEELDNDKALQGIIKQMTY